MLPESDPNFQDYLSLHLSFSRTQEPKHCLGVWGHGELSCPAPGGQSAVDNQGQPPWGLFVLQGNPRDRKDRLGAETWFPDSGPSSAHEGIKQPDFDFFFFSSAGN
jgi:hypothetical protein